MTYAPQGVWYPMARGRWHWFERWPKVDALGQVSFICGISICGKARANCNDLNAFVATQATDAMRHPGTGVLRTWPMCQRCQQLAAGIPTPAEGA